MFRARPRFCCWSIPNTSSPKTQQGFCQCLDFRGYPPSFCAGSWAADSNHPRKVIERILIDEIGGGVFRWLTPSFFISTPALLSQTPFSVLRLLLSGKLSGRKQCSYRARLDLVWRLVSKGVLRLGDGMLGGLGSDTGIIVLGSIISDVGSFLVCREDYL